MRRTGERRGGVAGALDAVRRRAERGLERGLRGEDAALLRGMVLGQDERLSDAVRDEFQVSGLAHLLAVSGQNVMLLAILVLAAAAAVGLPLRARLALALLLVAAYVPLAGGGPSIQRAGVMGAAGLVAALAGRPASRWYALGLAAAATLALNPLARARAGLAALVRGRDRAAGDGARAARAARAADARPGRGRGGDHGRRHRRHGAADGAALRVGLARLAARQPARRAGGRADHVARDAVAARSRRSRRRSPPR